MSVLADGYRRLAEELNIPVCLAQVLHDQDDHDDDQDDHGYDLLGPSAAYHDYADDQDDHGDDLPDTGGADHDYADSVDDKMRIF